MLQYWKHALAAVIAVLAIILIFVGASDEGFTDNFYLDQAAMNFSDPTLFKYTGREDDMLGLSGRDYYYNNTLHANNGVIAQQFDDNAYKNSAQYLDIEARYRPEHPRWARNDYTTFQTELQGLDPTRAARKTEVKTKNE